MINLFYPRSLLEVASVPLAFEFKCFTHVYQCLCLFSGFWDSHYQLAFNNTTGLILDPVQLRSDPVYSQTQSNSSQWPPAVPNVVWPADSSRWRLWTKTGESTKPANASQRGLQTITGEGIPMWNCRLNQGLRTGALLEPCLCRLIH